MAGESLVVAQASAWHGCGAYLRSERRGVACPPARIWKGLRLGPWGAAAFLASGYVGLRRDIPGSPPPFLLPPGVLLCETDCEAQRTWQDTEKSSDMEWAFYYYSGLAISMAREFK